MGAPLMVNPEVSKAKTEEETGAPALAEIVPLPDVMVEAPVPTCASSQLRYVPDGTLVTAPMASTVTAAPLDGTVNWLLVPVPIFSRS